MKRAPSPDTIRAYGAALSQWIGYLGLAFCAVAWLVTGRFEPVLFGGFGTLAGVGQGLETLRTLRSPKEDDA